MTAFLHLHRPDGVVVVIGAEHIVSIAPAEQGRGAPGHVSTVYLVSGQFREVRETVAAIEKLLATPEG